MRTQFCVRFGCHSQCYELVYDCMIPLDHEILGIPSAQKGPKVMIMNDQQCVPA